MPSMGRVALLANLHTQRMNSGGFQNTCDYGSWSGRMQSYLL